MKYVIVETYHKSDKCWMSFKYNIWFKIFSTECLYINISFKDSEECINELKQILKIKNIKPKILYILNSKGEKE
jgi:hypothetical protein